MVVNASLDSVNSITRVPLITAASFVPVMFTVIEEAVPSAACTVKVSVAFTPSDSWSCGEAAV